MAIVAMKHLRLLGICQRRLLGGGQHHHVDAVLRIDIGAIPNADVKRLSAFVYAEEAEICILESVSSLHVHNNILHFNSHLGSRD